MKKYLLNTSKEQLIKLGFSVVSSQNMFFNHLSAGEMSAYSIREKLSLSNDGVCQSEMFFGKEKETIIEERNKNVFFKLVEEKNIHTLHRQDLTHENYSGVVIKCYERKGGFGFKDLIMLETDGYSNYSDVLLLLSDLIVSEISKVELFEEYSLVSYKTNETFETEDRQRMSDLCESLGFKLFETEYLYWMKLLKIIDLSERIKPKTKLTQDIFYQELRAVLKKDEMPCLNQEKTFKQFMVFYTWFNTTYELLNSSREDYFRQKAEQLNMAKSLLEPNLF